MVVNSTICIKKAPNTSFSEPLLSSFKETLTNLRYNIKEPKQGRLYIYRFSDIKRYFKEIRTNNPRYRERFDNYIKKYGHSRRIDIK
jgi:hypothetical protein